MNSNATGFVRWGTFLLLSLPAPVSEAASNSPLSGYLLNRWDAESDCPAHGVNALVQTRDSYLWLGSQQGLFRYDGVRFTAYDRARFPELRSSHIRSLYEDSRGNLWIGTSGGGVSVLSGDSLRTISSREGLASDYVRAVAEDRDGVIWIGTDGEGITAVGPDTLISYGKENSILDERVTSLYVDRDNRLWIGTYAGLFSFDRTVFTRMGRRDGLPCDTVLSLYGRDDELWIGTYGGGLAKLQEGNIRSYGRENGLPGTVLTSITEDAEGTLWFTTLRGGVSRLADGVVSSRALGDIEQGEFAVSLACDREKNIWVGLFNGGLVQLREPLFTWFPLAPPGTSAMVAGVTADRGGTLWAATSAGLKTIGRGALLEPATEGLSGRSLITVAQAASGELWAGTWEGGAYRLTGTTFIPVPLPGVSTVWALFADADSAMWIGTSAGLFRVAGTSTTRVTHNEGGLSHDDVRAITRDAAGTLWVGTSYGLNKFEADSIRIITTATSGLPNDVIIALHADQAGRLWVGTAGGMACIRDDSITAFTLREGLVGETVGQILGDDHGYLWIVTDRGLFRILKSDFDAAAAGSAMLHPVAFGRADGLIQTNLSGMVQPSAWKTPDGRLWFAAEQGVAMIDPRSIPEETVPPQVFIEEFIADGISLPRQTDFEVGHDAGQFEIVYTAPSYIKPAKLRFRYMLEGLDHSWVDAGNRRRAYYSKIPPGSYTFRVMAGSGDARGYSTEASFALTVLPPFWQTWWFHGSLALLLAGAIFALYRRKVLRLTQEKARQSRFSSLLIETLEDERKRMAAEIHDSVGQGIIVMKNRALLGTHAPGDRSLVTEQFNEIADTAATTLEELRKIARNLRPVHLERFGLTDTIRNAVETLDQSSPIALGAELDPIDGIVASENEIHIFRIVQEALSNIVKHSGARSGSVRARKNPEGLTLTIQDDGRGFDAARLERDRHRVGIGLGNIMHRTEMLRGTASVSSVPGGGTTITVTIPTDPNRRPQAEHSGGGGS